MKKFQWTNIRTAGRREGFISPELEVGAESPMWLEANERDRGLQSRLEQEARLFGTMVVDRLMLEACVDLAVERGDKNMLFMAEEFLWALGKLENEVRVEGQIA